MNDTSQIQIFAEDQQAIEDEGIVIPMKPNVPLNNPYNRNHNNYYQPSSQPSAFARALPLYSTTVTNSPIAMMNYFNTPSSQHASHMEHESHFLQHHQQHAPPQHQQHIPIDLVS